MYTAYIWTNKSNIGNMFQYDLEISDENLDVLIKNIQSVGSGFNDFRRHDGEWYLTRAKIYQNMDDNFRIVYVGIDCHQADVAQNQKKIEGMKMKIELLQEEIKKLEAVR